MADKLLTLTCPFFKKKSHFMFILTVITLKMLLKIMKTIRGKRNPFSYPKQNISSFDRSPYVGLTKAVYQSD